MNIGEIYLGIRFFIFKVKFKVIVFWCIFKIVIYWCQRVLANEIL
jgi:hypothetical protein